jgi:thiamine pyrophosphokinase
MKYALVLNAPSLDVEIEEQLIIAADGGYRLVKDKPVQAVIGDFDTLGYLPDDVKTITHPTDKDKTDGEICLDYVKSVGGNEVTIYGGTGGHVDHVLGNVNLLAYAQKVGLRAKMVDAESTIYFLTSNLVLEGEKGDVLSIIPFGGACSFKNSSGLKYSLEGLTIEPFSSLGISNSFLEGRVEIVVENGACLVIIRKKS